jgi:predicted Zn-dependent peptidase
MRKQMKLHKLLIPFAVLIATVSSAQSTFPPIEKYKLKNGLEVILADYGTLPVTSLSFFVKVGKSNETPGQQGLATITANSIGLGSEKYDRLTLDKMVSEMGGKLSSGSYENYSEIRFMFPNTDMDKAMEVMSDMMLRPKFPQEDIKQQVAQMLNYNNPVKMDIAALADVFSDHFVFTSANPLGRYFYAAQLNKLTPANVQEFYKFNYTPKNTRLVISGKTDKEKIKKLVEQYFGPWTAEFGEVNGAVYETPAINKKEYAFVNKTKASQAALRWTKKAPAAGSKDAIPFRLTSYVFYTVLFDEIRAKEGKTYGISMQYDEKANTSLYNISTQVRNEVMHGTIVSVERVMKEFYEKGMTEEKLKTAKAIIKSELMTIENPQQFSDFINPLLYSFDKRKEYIAEIEKVDLATVNKIIKKYYDPSSYKLVIAGDETALADQLSKITGLQKLSLKSIEVDQ